MSKIKSHIVSSILCVVFLIGLSMLLYPTFANWWNSWNAAQATGNYIEQVSSMNLDKLNTLKIDAIEYNRSLLDNLERFNPTDSEKEEYNEMLSLNSNNVMGTILIPQIKVTLPIYHGTSDSVLAIGAGHLQGSSLPIGGIGTHAVITGHRGLPSARLFTDLDRLVEGDYVILKVLNETLTYQIDTIRIVLPQEVEGLTIEPDKDLLTLVTCTPYGVNTHRMLLTGHRVENLTEWEAASDAGQIDTKMVALFIAVPILVGLFIWLMINYRKPRGDSDEEDKNNSNQ